MTEKQIKQIEELKENLIPVIDNWIKGLDDFFQIEFFHQDIFDNFFRYLVKCEPDRYSDLLSYIYDHMDITKDELGLVLNSLIENK